MTKELLDQAVTIDAIPLFRLTNRYILMRVFWSRAAFIIADTDHVLTINGNTYTYTDSEAKDDRYSKEVIWDTKSPLRLTITIGECYKTTEINAKSMNLAIPVVTPPECIRAEFINKRDSIVFNVYSNAHRINKDTRRIELYKATYPDTPTLFKISHAEITNFSISTDYTDYDGLFYQGQDEVSSSGLFSSIYASRKGVIFKIKDALGNMTMWPNQAVVSTPSFDCNWANLPDIQDSGAPYYTTFYIPKGELSLNSNLSVQVALIDTQNNFTGFSSWTSLGTTLQSLLPTSCTYMDTISSYADTEVADNIKYNYKYIIRYIDEDYNQEFTESIVTTRPFFYDIPPSTTKEELINPQNDAQLTEYDFQSGVVQENMKVVLSDDRQDYEKYLRFIREFTEIDDEDICRVRS